MTQLLVKWWNYLTGHGKGISIENRTFNAISLITTVHLATVVFSNIALRLYTMAWWATGMVLLLFSLFYLSRFKNKFVLSSTAFAILSYPAISGIYILNGGVSGPGSYGFLISFLVIIVITKPKTHIYWFILHCLFMCGLFALEVFKPEWIVNPYYSKEDHIIDLILSYIPVLLFIYIAASFLRKGYNYEKHLAAYRLEAINTKRKELEYTNKEKDRLFSIIGHDLRSPLFSIQGYLEVLNSTELSEKDRIDIQNQLYELTTNTSHLLNNLLLWSSKTGSELKLNAINLQEATKEMISLVEPQAYKKNVEINCAVPTEKIFVEADNDMLQLVLRNLLSNAVKFTPEKGNVRIWFEPKEKTVSIYVQDTGIGIPENKKADIFTSKAKSTHGTAHESGTGLGLVLCQEFVSAMSGSISFESIENTGSTFVVTLNKS